jgi:MinD superfamily P-loop ATPase
MKQLVILSGKGGTGKTTVAGAFIRLAQDKAFADCDVDAPNLHLVMNDLHRIDENEFYALKKAVKYEEACVHCGKCEQNCRFGAITNGTVNIHHCEGCGVCEYFCTAANLTGIAAIRLEDNVSGHTYVSKVNDEIFSHAQLKIGNGASGKLVTEVRKRLYSEIKDEKFIIIDGSPGIGCPVIASVTGTDAVLVVTEPSLSGLHDLKRIVQVARRFETPCAVCINKYDINIEAAGQIEQYCHDEKILFAGRIPYDPAVIEAVNCNRSIVEYDSSPAAQAVKELWIGIKEWLDK